MKYQGVVELSVREYLGIENGATAWRIEKNVIGIKLNGEVYDYKTLEKYNFLDRKKSGEIDLKGQDLIVGEVYAVLSPFKFDSEKICTDRTINEYIISKDYFTEDYVKAKPKIKQMLKQK